MTLRQLIAALGAAEVARRTGVNLTTLSRWVRLGPSARGAERVSEVIRRYKAAKKSAETRRIKVESERRKRFTLPPETELTPEQVLPTKTPKESKDVSSIKRSAGVSRQGVRRIDSSRSDGFVNWIRIEEDINDLDENSVIDQAVNYWEETGRDKCSVKLLFLRYIPYNPIYKGEMISKQGTWVDQWVTTATVSASNSIRNQISYYIDRAREWAETRVIFLGMIGVFAFDRTPNAPKLKDIEERPLR